MLILCWWKGKRNRSIAFIKKTTKKPQNKTKKHPTKNKIKTTPPPPQNKKLLVNFTPLPCCYESWPLILWEHKEISLLFLLVYSDIYREWSTPNKIFPFCITFFFFITLFLLCILNLNSGLFTCTVLLPSVHSHRNLLFVKSCFTMTEMTLMFASAVRGCTQK